MPSEPFSFSFEIVEKSAWAIFLIVLLVLFLPIELAKQLKLNTLRAEYTEYLWLGLIFSGLLTLASLKRYFWQYIICPFKKLLFPITDARNGLKQSRMRYYLIQFSLPNGESQTAYQEVTSEGSVKRYVTISGKSLLLPKGNVCNIIDGEKFQFPNWEKTDWSDIFSGILKSGCWGISEPN